MKTITFRSKELGFEPGVSLADNMAVLPGSETRRSGSTTTTESTSSTSGLGSGSGSTPSTTGIGRDGRSTVSDSWRNIGASRLGSVGGGRKSSRGLLVSVAVHVRGSGVGGEVGFLGGSSLSSHVRRDIGGSGRVKLDAVCWSARVMVSSACHGIMISLRGKRALTELGLKSGSTVGLSNRSSSHNDY